MSSFQKDSFFAIAVMALVVLFWHQTYSMPASAAVFPRMLMVLISLLVLAMMIHAYIRRALAEDMPLMGNVARLGLFLLLLVGYVLCVEPVGYFFATPVFVVAGCAVIRAVGLVPAAIIGVGFTAFIYALFVGFLHLPVPLGLLANFVGG